jgi:hypothetical protein
MRVLNKMLGFVLKSMGKGTCVTTGTAGFELPRDTRCVPQYSNTFSAVAASTGEGDANNTAHKVAARRAHANDDSDGEPSRAMVLQPNQNESHAV